jgi:uncharacterized membrane protein
VLADNSQGMQIHDAGDSKSRGENMRGVLDLQKPGWQAALAETFDIRRYLFDTRLQATTDFHELAFDGRASALGSAVRTLSERFQGRPLAGILMLTDGNATDMPAGVPDLTGVPPVYPVVIGRKDAINDIAVQQVAVTQSAFEDAPVSLQANVATAGYRGQPVVARLVDRTGKIMQEQTTDARADNEPLAFRFQLKPELPGLSYYQVRVTSKADAAAADKPEPANNEPAPQGRTGEATMANNRRVVAVDRGQGPFRVLYVSGRPNWEFKFLNRALQEDAQVQLVALIRVAKREPKFDFRGRMGETSNPLFRGFGNQSVDEIQRYDQPVLQRLFTRDEFELQAGFPRTPEDLYGYHAVILDDVEAEFFSPDQALLLQKFVSERGGGLLMLGGMESFHEGNYLHTPIGDALPVYLDRSEDSAEPPGAVNFSLAREGWLQAWARLRETESDERARMEKMVAFEVVNRVRGIKPGASVIATVRDTKGTELPGLVVQRFGRGRSAALMVGDFWRWGFQDAASHADMDKAWRQLVRWMIADVPARVQCTVEPLPADANGAVQIQVRVRNEKFQAVDDASVTIEVEPVVFDGTAGAAAAPIKLEAEAALSEPGLYQATYVPRQTGGYKAVAMVKNGAGAELGRAEAGWSTDLAAEEFRSLAPNVALLEEIARKTGGQVVPLEDLDKFVAKIPRGIRRRYSRSRSRVCWRSGACDAGKACHDRTYEHNVSCRGRRSLRRRGREFNASARDGDHGRGCRRRVGIST